MTEKKRSFLCGCFGSKLKRNEEDPADQTDIYEDASNSNQSNLAPIVAFQSGQENADPSEPSSSVTNSNSTNRHHLFGLSWRRHKDRKLPQVPKSVTFSRDHNIPHIDDPIPTYESIDLTSEAAYSKLDDRQRYDYPIFPQRGGNRRRNMEENLYVSASQTYSVGSEDPYSSIASVCDNNRTANDDASVGYARVNEEQMRADRQRNSNVDDMYAKVNRKAALERRIQNGLLPSTSGIRSFQQIQPSTSVNYMPDNDEDAYQINESGSGSITSSSSCNPSYRYLTVRETLGVIRERIRRRNEEANYSGEGSTSAAKEHYYSTISNDYESVRNETNQQPSTSAILPPPQQIPSAPPSNRNSLLMNELKITTNLPNGQPKPPTSPIPLLPPSKLPTSQTKPVNGHLPVSLNQSCSNFSVASTNPTALTFAKLPPLFPITTPRILWPSSNLDGTRIACSTSMTSRPIVISMANVLRKHESSPNITYLKSVGTSTDDLNQTPRKQKSKIPRLVNNNRVYSRYANSLMTKSQESALTSRRSQLKRPPSLGFIPFSPVGNDYVSLIDFPRKSSISERGWPFVIDRTL